MNEHFEKNLSYFKLPINVPSSGANNLTLMSQSPVSRNPSIETRMGRPKSIMGVIWGVVKTVDVSCIC